MVKCHYGYSKDQLKDGRCKYCSAICKVIYQNLNATRTDRKAQEATNKLKNVK